MDKFFQYKNVVSGFFSKIFNWEYEQAEEENIEIPLLIKRKE